jgi:hypothetical protein
VLKENNTIIERWPVSLKRSRDMNVARNELKGMLRSGARAMRYILNGK